MCDLLVFSQGNTSVKMVDARNCKVKERFTSKMTQKNIDEILRRISEETDYSCKVSHKEISDQAYAISPVRYMTDTHVKIENGVPLGELLISLERG